jgi:hypothetical protein
MATSPSPYGEDSQYSQVTRSPKLPTRPTTTEPASVPSSVPFRRVQPGIAVKSENDHDADAFVYTPRAIR